MEQDVPLQAQEIKAPDPSYSNSFSHGWATMKKNFLELLLVIFIQIMMSLPIGFADTVVDRETVGYGFYTLFNIAYAIIVLTPINYGACLLYLKAVRGEPFKMQEIFYAYQQI